MQAGIDEAGRGCILGPVYAAAVIWNDEISHPLLRDSKKLSAKQRDQMFDFIQDNAIDFGIASVSAREIDKLNILNATIDAMHLALDKLNIQLDSVVVDGNHFRYYTQNDELIPHQCVIGGDNKYNSIMAASILAKVSHDKYMSEINNQYPEYDLVHNQGYCTKKHEEAVKLYGRCEYHRKTFRLPFEKIM